MFCVLMMPINLNIVLFTIFTVNFSINIYLKLFTCTFIENMRARAKLLAFFHHVQSPL